MSSSRVVTITGSITPSVALARGVSRTVTLTPRIQRLIDKGYVTVTEEFDAPAPPAPSEPSKTASRAAWAEFLTSEGFDVPTDATRAELIETWEGFSV